MDLMNMLKGHFDEKQIKALADKLGESTDTVKKAVDSMLPSIMGGISSKLSFLDKDGDGDIMDDVKSMFGMGGDTAKKAETILNDKAADVAATVSKESGLSEDKAKSLLDEVTAQTTGFLGGLTGGGSFDIKGLLGQFQTQGAGMLDSVNKQFGNVLGGLDKDGDGSVIDDIQDMGKNLLGGFFGKK